MSIETGWSCLFEMGRQSSDHPAVVGSSTALLQERFRQLERVREKREKQGHGKLFLECEEVGPTTGFQHKMIFPLLPNPQDHALSLRLCSHPRKLADFRAIKTGTLANRFTDSTIMSTSPNVDNSEIDTSLHL